MPAQLPEHLLSEPRRHTLAAAAGRILPSDDGPGALDTGVAAYLDKVLGEAPLRPIVPWIEKGLDLLDALARETHGQAFTVCSPGGQDEVLRRVESHVEEWPRVFLRRLVLLVLEGFLCDPARGGNRGGLGWRYIGYPTEAPGSASDPGARG